VKARLFNVLAIGGIIISFWAALLGAAIGSGLVIVAFTAVSIVLGICMFLHFRLYNEQQRKSDGQNAVLAQISRGKTEFLANTSHEMRTPLTVISVNIQKVMYLLADTGRAAEDPEATRLLADAQGEIMRLSRMVDGMLTLASISESPARRKTDFTALLRSAADILELFLAKRKNRLKADIAENLTVFGDSDLLSQIIVNLIQNAHAHTENDVILLRAALDKRKITVTVSDNGAGIAPDLLPRVFERGVSGGGGTGVGLHLCKTVVESHGGEIWIDSEPGKGATVYFTIPAYEGQYGDDAG
jgi:signal transduction histidine kinase